jgi:inhibitor of KinA sporulation pathway (predicted exonuclease)
MLYLVIDFETTCCQRNSFPRHEMEIIEFGVVLCQGFSPIKEFQSFVQPVRHPILTEFCTTLTSIQQKDIDYAPGFIEVMNRFTQFLTSVEEHEVRFCSWGNFDKNILQQNCNYHTVPYPFSEHFNLKKLFQHRQNLDHSMGMIKALHHKSIQHTGTHHRGIEDARNISKLLPFCF